LRKLYTLPSRYINEKKKIASIKKKGMKKAKKKMRGNPRERGMGIRHTYSINHEKVGYNTETRESKKKKKEECLEDHAGINLMVGAARVI